MKRSIAILFFMLVFSAIVFASPFIISDPQTDATKFRMRLSADNGATWSAWVEGDPVSGGAKFDLAGVQKGVYKGEMQAGAYCSVTDSTTNVTTTVWIWSESAPFVLDQQISGKPVNIKVTQ
jgi:hypothetical protein